MGACEIKSDTNRKVIKNRIEELECNAEKIKEYLELTVDKEIEKKQKCRDEWLDCLKKREERKNKVQKEMNSAFIPCVVQKKAGEFHDCLKCYRRTNACVLQKKQEVFLAGSRKKIVAKQLALVNEDLKQAGAFLKEFDKIVKKNESFTETAKKDNLTEKSKLILSCIDNSEWIISCADDSSDYKNKINCIVEKWKEQHCTKEKSPFKSDENKEFETFVKAYERMIGDFSLYEIDSKCKTQESFSNRAIERCRILRDYDQGGAELLGCLEHKILSNDNSIEKSKLNYEQRAKEYEEYVSNAQKNYKKAMTLFSQIVKTPELNCLQKHCITLKNNNGKYACWMSNLESEKKCNSYWRELNSCRFSIQKGFVEGKESDAELADNHKKNQSILTTDCCKDTPDLDTWEASIPDYLWENLIKYEEARYLLSQVASIFHGECKKESKCEAMENALGCWVDAFIDKDKKNNHHDHLMQHAYELLKEQVAYAEKNNTDRIQATIRGDANTFIGQDLYVIFQDIKEILCLINTDGSDDAKTCRQTSMSGTPYDIDPYNLPSDELCKLSKLDLSNKNLPKPCTPCIPPCKECGKEHCNKDDYPCIKDPKCLEDEDDNPNKASSNVQQHATIQEPPCDCGQ